MLKLARIEPGEAPAGFVVITSYSIHYTKLYEVAWRQSAKTTLLPGLQAYEAVIRDTIGVRLQSRLTRDQALEMANCTSAHRDISLHF